MRRPYFAATARRSTRTARGEERLLDLVHGTERVPGAFLVPSGAGPAPAALLLHGFSSSKERMTHSVGRALQQRGGVGAEAALHRGSRRRSISQRPRDRVGRVFCRK